MQIWSKSTTTSKRSYGKNTVFHTPTSQYQQHTRRTKLDKYDKIKSGQIPVTLT